jgi:limonene-1,2-epoxide hydrolase
VAAPAAVIEGDPMDECLVERNLAAVRRVCEGWAEMDRDEFHRVFAPDVDYRNIPIDGDEHHGPDAVHDVLCRFREKWEVTLRVDNIVGDERVVLTERTEHFVHRAGARGTFDLPVMGAFELREGKITAWRDYFDRTQLRLR